MNSKQKWILALAALAAFMTALDTLVVTTALSTIRGDLASDQGTKVVQNIVHGSDSADSAKREIALWFPEL